MDTQHTSVSQFKIACTCAFILNVYFIKENLSNRDFNLFLGNEAVNYFYFEFGCKHFMASRKYF